MTAFATGFTTTALSEVEALHALCAEHPVSVSVETVGQSAEGRAIEAVTVTDRAVSDDQKQHVLIVAGQHGNEESGRWVALGLVEWLVSPLGEETRRRQKIVILPNANPDAAARNEHDTPSGVAMNLDHGPGGPVTPEAQAVEKVAETLHPEVFVDLHAMGHVGCGYEMVLWPWTRPYSEDGVLFQTIASQMAEAGERSGIPHVTHPLTWSGWGSGPDEPSSTVYAYQHFKSIVMLTESAESDSEAYPLALRVRSGVQRLVALLAWGNRRHPKLPYDGYPNLLVTGSYARGVMAVGRTAAERRASRLAAWRQVGAFERVRVAIPEAARRKVLEVKYSGEPLAAVGFVVAAAGELAVRSVTWDGRALPTGETDGYTSWRVDGATYTVVAVRDLVAGAHEAAITFD